MFIKTRNFSTNDNKDELEIQMKVKPGIQYQIWSHKTWASGIYMFLLKQYILNMYFRVLLFGLFVSCDLFCDRIILVSIWI